MESPFTRPLPILDTFPASPSEIRVRVYNAVIKQPSIGAVDSFESTPKTIEEVVNLHTSNTDVNVSDAGDEEARFQEAQTADATRDSIQILGPLPVQLMSVSLASSSGPGSSSSSDTADEHSSRLDTTSLNRCKSLPDLRPLYPSATPPSSPILSVKSMVDVSPSFLCLDENAPTAFREDQAQRPEDVDEGVPDDHDNRDSSDAPEARLAQAPTRPTLQPWVMVSYRCLYMQLINRNRSDGCALFAAPLVRVSCIELASGRLYRRFYPFPDHQVLLRSISERSKSDMR